MTIVVGGVARGVSGAGADERAGGNLAVPRLRAGGTGAARVPCMGHWDRGQRVEGK
jgi:hypothetical protein